MSFCSFASLVSEHLSEGYTHDEQSSHKSTSCHEIMQEITVPFMHTNNVLQSPPPVYASPESAGADMHANIQNPLHMEPMSRHLVPTGIAMALPQGYEAQVRSRSGLAWKHGICVLTSPGTIDSDYRGEIFVLLANLGQELFVLQPQERIAQLVISPVAQAVWKLCPHLSQTSRGQKGFGSTGTHPLTKNDTSQKSDRENM